MSSSPRNKNTTTEREKHDTVYGVLLAIYLLFMTVFVAVFFGDSYFRFTRGYNLTVSEISSFSQMITFLKTLGIMNNTMKTYMIDFIDNVYILNINNKENFDTRFNDLVNTVQAAIAASPFFAGTDASWVYRSVQDAWIERYHSSRFHLLLLYVTIVVMMIAVAIVAVYTVPVGVLKHLKITIGLSLLVIGIFIVYLMWEFYTPFCGWIRVNHKPMWNSVKDTISSVSP